MEESILLCIKYYLSKKNNENNDKDIDVFYDNGKSFPSFIAKIYNIFYISGIIKEPKNQKQREKNNEKALLFLCQNSPQIQQNNPSLKTKQDRLNLLKLILIIHCFPENSNIIMNKLNMVFEPYQIRIDNEKDIYNYNVISLLLNIFTEGQFPRTDSFQVIYQNCQNSGIPLVINEKSTEKQNLFIFLIQIQIFFDFFTGCNQQMLESIKSKLSTKVAKTNKNQVDNSNNLPNMSDDEISHLIFLWNQSEKKYIYYNGILIKKNDIIKEFKPFYDIQMEEPHDKNNNFYQLFKYDKDKCRWVFCQKNFEKLFLCESEMNLPIRLDFFLNSNLQKTLEVIFQEFKMDIFECDLGEEISVFAFKQEISVNGKDISYILFIHIPENEIEHSNIRSIIYQISTFLISICDNCIILVSDHLTVPYQFFTIAEIIIISDFYINSQNEEDQDIFFNQSKFNIILLTKGSSQENLLELKKVISNIINKDCKVDDLTGSIFIFKPEQFEYSLKYHYSELLNAFIYCNKKFSEISEGYLNYRFDDFKNGISYSIKDIIKREYDFFSIRPKYMMNKKFFADTLKNESAKFYPECDILYANNFEANLIKKLIDTECFDKDSIISKLKEKSNLHLEKIKQIKSKKYCSQNDIDTLKRGHISFLQKQFFKIIKESFNNSVGFAYEKLIGILDSQINDDDEKIENIFSMNELNVNEGFDEAKRHGTNFVIKEVETTREIEINIESDEELEKIIPQDF